MKTLLILGAGIEQAHAIGLAKRKGIKTIAFDKNPKALGATVADEFYPISTRDIKSVTDFLKKYNKKIDGVMTIASDIPHVVSAAADVLNVPHIPLSVAQICVDKFRMKEVLKAGGVNVPAFKKVDSLDSLKVFIADVKYPVVIKPTDNAGAKGVLLLVDGIDLEWAFEYSKKHSFSGNVIAEKFIAGPQISTEGIMRDNVFYCTGFGDRNYEHVKKTAPHLVEDGGNVPSLLKNSEQTLVRDEFEKAVRALGIDWGPGKGDMVLGEDGKAYVVEIAARLSGHFCYNIMPWSTGVNIADILIDMSVGNKINVKQFIPIKNLAIAQRFMFPSQGIIKEIRGGEYAKQSPYIKKIDFWVRPGDKVEKTVNHSSRAGYVISCAPSVDEAVFAAKRAVDTIEFIME